MFSKRNSKTHTFIIALFLTVLYGCAKVGAPTGGPKDLDPPALLSTVPAEQGLNFRGQTITLVFDEEIEENNLRKNLIITPNTGQIYKTKVRRNVFSLTFEQPLIPNTTYSIYFREGIRDITERNFNKALKLSFSTGANIDQYYIDGSVKDVLSGKYAAETLVGLYIDSDTLDVSLHQPQYFTYTDADGSFLLENLPQATYKIFALGDRNDNLLVNVGEKVAMLDNQVVSDTLSTDLKLRLFLPNDELLRIKRASKRRLYTNINVSKPFREATLQSSDDSELLGILDKENLSTIQIYSFSAQDSSRIIFSFIDSLNRHHDTSLFIPTVLYKPLTAKAHYTVEQNNLYKAENDSFSIELSPSVIITDINSSKVLISTDSSDYKPVESIIWNKWLNTIRVGGKYNYNDSIRVKVLKDALTNIDDQILLNDTVFLVQAPSSAKYGSISGKLIIASENSIVQLVDQKDKVIGQTASGSDNFFFTSLPPGNYRLRVLNDTDGNNYWTTGSLRENKQPEQLIYHPEVLVLKANWTIEDVQIVK